MLQGSLSRDARGRVIGQGLLQQVQAGGVQLLDALSQRVGLPVGKGWLVVGKAGHSWPRLLCRCGQSSGEDESAI